MYFNSDKFNCIKTGFNEDIKLDYTYLSPDLDNIIEDKEVVKDLGIYLSNNGSFTFHINQVIKKVKQRCGWIHRSFNLNTIVFRRFMWRTYVLGIIDYRSQLWCPVDGNLMSRIENLQRIYTINTKGLENDDYWTRLRKMKLSSLERRFQRYRIIYIWKVMNGFVSDCGINWIIHPYKGRLVKIIHPKMNANIKCSSKALSLWRQSLPVNGASLYNKMPQYIRDCTDMTIDCFKSRLDKYLKTIPDCLVTKGLYPDPINPVTGKNSNCLIDWINYINRNKGFYMGNFYDFVNCV